MSTPLSEDQKRRLIKKYFDKFPMWALKMLGIGIVVATFSWIGFAAIAAALLIMGLWMQKPTESQLDAWTDEDLVLMKDRALIKSGLDESELIRDSVLVVSPRFWRIGGAAIGLKKGRDNKVRFMPIGVAVIQFTQHQLVTYQCALDLTTGNYLNESVEEYFYTDIVSVSTSARSVTIEEANISTKFLSANPNIQTHIKNGKLQLNDAETFELTTSGGNSVQIVLREPMLMNTSDGDLPTYLAEEAVQAVRKMVKSKKYATA